MGREGFYTLRGYHLLEHGLVTSAMEDYLEMIYRMSGDSSVVRVSALSAALHVKPSSASKMAGNLRARELVEFPKYGYITLTELGRSLGGYFVKRHEILGRFLCAVNSTEEELEEVEKVEHFFSPRTIANLEKFLKKHGIDTRR